jgi:hypothetical protein
MGLESTTAVVSEPALSFSYDPKRPLYEQFGTAIKSSPNPVESDPEGTSPAGRQARPESITHASTSSVSLPELDYSTRSSMESFKSSLDGASVHTEPPTPSQDAPPPNPLARSPFFSMFALFEGSPTYKQRRKKPNKGRSYTGDEDKDNSNRLSLDIGSQSLDTSKHSLEGASPKHSQPRKHPAGPAGSCQFRFMSGAPKISPSAPDGRLGQQTEGAPSLPAPTPSHRCPLFTCRETFSNAKLLQDHMRAHDDRQRAEKHQGDMDMEVEDAHAYPNGQVVRGTQQLQYPRGSPEIPQFTHVLTSPDGSSTYDGEDDQAYTAPGQWAPQSAKSTAYSSTVTSPVASAEYAYFFRPPAGLLLT